MMTNTAFYFRYVIQRYLFIKKHDVILWIVSFGVKAQPTFISKPSVHVSGLSCWCIFPDWQWSAKLSCALNMSTFEGCCRTAPNSCHLTNAHVSVANPTRTVTTHRINFSSPCCCFKRVQHVAITAQSSPRHQEAIKPVKQLIRNNPRTTSTVGKLVRFPIDWW